MFMVKIWSEERNRKDEQAYIQDRGCGGRGKCMENCSFEGYLLAGWSRPAYNEK
jgi:MinD superfamily P-loop ATPase